MRDIGAGVQVVGAGAIGDQRVGARLRLCLRAADQLLRLGPAQPHAALRGVHGLGDAEPEVPQPMAEFQRRGPSRWPGSSHGSLSASGSATTCAAA